MLLLTSTGCGVWHLNDSNMQKISVAWNSCFRCIFHVVGDKALNHYNSFVTHCQYHTCYTSANYCFGKILYCSDSIVLQSLSRPMHQAFIAVGSLYNVLSPKLSNNSVRDWFRIHLPCLWTCDSRDIISVFLMFFIFLYNSCVCYCSYICMSGCHLT